MNQAQTDRPEIIQGDKKNLHKKHVDFSNVFGNFEA